MGIEHLYAILDEKKCGQSVALNRLRHLIKTDRCCIAIDAKLIFHKYLSTYWKIVAESRCFSYARIYTECVKQIKQMCSLLKGNGMEQLWCLDGDRTDDKLATSRRISAREPKLIQIARLHKWLSTSDGEEIETPEELLPYTFIKQYWHLVDDTTAIDTDCSVEALKQLLIKHIIVPSDFAEVMTVALKKEGCQFLCVPDISEGEKLCVVAVQSGYCQAVLTTDTDVFPMGVRYVIKEIKEGVARVYSYSQALHNLGMTHEQFLSLCVLLGNDFNDGVKDMAKVKCLAEAARDKFNLYDFDLSRCGCLRPNTCINAFTVSNKEYAMVCAAIEAM